MTETDFRRLAQGRQFPGETDKPRMALWPAVFYIVVLWGGVALASSVIGW